MDRREFLKSTGAGAAAAAATVATGAVAAETALACRDIARRYTTPDARVVCTVGTVKVEPGIVTAVPGVCEISLDQRALDPGVLAKMLADAKAASAINGH